jgi:glycolate oxidase iron-sulfur subunit
MPGDLPIIVNSAGCGSTMKEYESLIGPEGEAFAARVTDLSEFLLAHGLKDKLAAGRLKEPVTYHDACHLAHGQKIRSQPRELIQSIPNVDYRELGEADTCCGSAGIYNLTQPALARQLIERKYRHIQATGATLVATGNPGCHAWIAQAAAEHGRTVRVLHTAELLEMAFDAAPFTA